MVVAGKNTAFNKGEAIMARKKTKYRKKNGNLKNNGRKRLANLKKVISELERAISKRTGMLRTCSCQQQTDLQAEISYLQNRLDNANKKMRQI